MSERTLKQLVGALAVLAVIGIVGSIFRGGSGTISASGAMAGFFDGIDGASVQEIRVVRGDRSVALSRRDTVWTVNGFPADPEGVGGLLAIIDEASVGDLVAANPDNHDRMGVSNDSAFVVTFTTGARERTLLVGKSGRGFGTAYVRLPDADEVYLLDGDLRPQLGRDVEAWRNRTMVALDTAAVARIVVDRTDGGYALVRADSAWTFEGGGDAVVTSVEGVLSELARMVATGFVSEGDSIAGLPRAATTTAYGSAGEVLAEVWFGAGEGDRWARTTSDDFVYRVSSFRANRVAPAKDAVTPGA